MLYYKQIIFHCNREYIYTYTWTMMYLYPYYIVLRYTKLILVCIDDAQYCSNLLKLQLVFIFPFPILLRAKNTSQYRLN